MFLDFSVLVFFVRFDILGQTSLNEMCRSYSTTEISCYKCPRSLKTRRIILMNYSCATLIPWLAGTSCRAKGDVAIELVSLLVRGSALPSSYIVPMDTDSSGCFFFSSSFCF